MQLVPVTSSALSGIGWQHEIGLIVRFNGGKIWAYEADRNLFEEIMASQSKGQAFDRLVKKPKLSGVEITEDELQSLVDDSDPSATRHSAWQHKTSNPVMYLGELLKTNRPSAYF